MHHLLSPFKHFLHTLHKYPFRYVGIGIFVACISLHTTNAQMTSTLEYSTDQTPFQDLKPAAETMHPRDVIQWHLQSAVLYANHYLSIFVGLERKNNFSIYTDKLQVTTGFPSLGSGVSHMVYPKTQIITDPLTQKPTPVFQHGTFEIIIKIPPNTKPSIDHISITYLSCSEKVCLFPYTYQLPINYLTSTKDYSIPPAARTINAIFHTNTPIANKTVEESSSTETDFSWNHQLARSFKSRGISFFWMLLICFLGGLLTNLTPCVYPMIPITMKVLSKHSSSPFLASFTYGAGIFTTYLALGLIAALGGGFFGSIVASQSFNTIFGLLMMIVAFSMLGYGNFSFMQRLGTKIPVSSSGTKNAFFMGGGAGFVAAPCTGPVLAGLMSYAIVELTSIGSLMLFSAYSLGFASPYVFFGSAIAHMGKISLPANTQNLIKLLMASTLMTLAFYYWRIPLHQWIKDITHTQWTILAASFLCVGGCMALTVMLKSKMQKNIRLLIGPMLALAIGLFASIQWIQRSSQDSLPWMEGSQKTSHLLKSPSTPVLVSLWAEWCAACKVMESSTFQNPQVTQLLKAHNFRYIKYDLTIMNDTSTDLLQRYNIHGLPAYILISPVNNHHQANNTSEPDMRLKVLHGVYEADHFISLINLHLQNP